MYMKNHSVLYLVIIILFSGCVSRKLALRQPHGVPSSVVALSKATHAVAYIVSTSANLSPIKSSAVSNGIIISEDGYLLTVSHGLSYDNPVVYIDDERYSADIVYNNKKYDFAILKIVSPRPLPFIRFARETNLKQNVFLIGKFRRNREIFMSQGILNVKGINMSSREINWVSTDINEKKKVDYAIQNGILHSARFFEGLSGCPLLDENGDVIGMNSGLIGGEDGRISLALELIVFLPIIQKYSDVQIPRINECADTADWAIDLNDPLKRLDWVMKGLFQYCSLLGKNTARMTEIRGRVEKQAMEKIRASKHRDKEAIQWAWKTFLTEVYAIK